MAKRRVKKRTHVGAKGAQANHGDAPTKPGARAPKSMVIRIGASDVGPSVSQLVKDVRSMMEPNTAARLKERRHNKLRDYTTMAGPLGVSHLLLFSRSESGNTNMRLAITPRGPTLHFRVDKYSLCKDVLKSMKRPKSDTAGYLTSPLLVMNNFIQSTADTPASKESPEEGKPSTNPIPKQLESLTTTIFQSLFAPISPQQTSLNSIKRIMLVDRMPSKASKPSDPNSPATEDEDHQFVLQLRHYAIKAVTPKHSLPKALRRLENAEKLTHGPSKGLPNLGKLDDVADYLLDPTAAAGFTSASESEADTDAEVEVLAPENRKVMGKEDRQRMRDAQRIRIAAQTAAAEGNAAAGAEGSPAPGARREREIKTQKKAIKLQELGPRMTLRLTKVEEGLCGGKIMWHEYISKTKAEEKKQESTWAARRQEKDVRKKLQKENVEAKKKDSARVQKAKTRDAAAKAADGEEEDEEMDDVPEEDWSDDDDDEWHGEHDGEGGDAFAPDVMEEDDDEEEEEDAK